MQRVHSQSKAPNGKQECGSLSSYLQLLRLIGYDSSSVSYLQEVSEICNVYSVIELLFTEFAECKTQ